MQPTQPKAPYTETGYLKARVFTALGAIPIDNASVKISSAEGAMPPVAHDLLTDKSGETPVTALPAPPRALSEHPGEVAPYALYRIEAYKTGYSPYLALNVPVFSEILSVQPISLVPLPENDTAPPIQPIVEREAQGISGSASQEEEI